MADGQARDRLAADLTEALTPEVGALGLDLEAVGVTPAGRRRVLRIAVDKDGGVTLDDVADATRAISRHLDSSDVMGEQPYTLEVTSPGVERPLTLPRHWRRNRGRLVEARLADGSVVIGRVAVSDDDAAVLVVDGVQRRVAYPEVQRALVQVELNRPAGAGGGEDPDEDEEG